MTNPCYNKLLIIVTKETCQGHIHNLMIETKIKHSGFQVALVVRVGARQPVREVGTDYSKASMVHHGCSDWG